MTFNDWIEIIAAAATMVLLAAVAISDITRYRIPNVHRLCDRHRLSGRRCLQLRLARVRLGDCGREWRCSCSAPACSPLACSAAAMSSWRGDGAMDRFRGSAALPAGIDRVRRCPRSVLWLFAAVSSPRSPARRPGRNLPHQTHLRRPRLPSHGSRRAPASTSRIPYGVAIAVAGFDFFILRPILRSRQTGHGCRAAANPGTISKVQFSQV